MPFYLVNPMQQANGFSIGTALSEHTSLQSAVNANIELARNNAGRNLPPMLLIIVETKGHHVKGGEIPHTDMVRKFHDDGSQM